MSMQRNIRIFWTIHAQSGDNKLCHKAGGEEGFVPYVRGMELRPGTKIYKANRGKALILAVIGSKPLDEE